MQLSVREAARLLGVSDQTVYRWIHQGEIPHIRVSDQYRFNRVELLEWATARRRPVSPDIVVEPDEGPLPSLGKALEAGGVHHDVPGTGVPEVLHHLVRLLPLTGEAERDHLYQVLLARERLGSTGIGDGIAIPHARNPIVLGVARPSLSLCFLRNPVDFDAVDGKPVRVIFLLVSPTARAHLHLLSRLAYCLRKEEIRGLLSREAGPAEILDVFRRAEMELPPAAGGEGR